MSESAEESPLLVSKPVWFRQFVRNCFRQFEEVLTPDVFEVVRKVVLNCLEGLVVDAECQNQVIPKSETPESLETKPNVSTATGTAPVDPLQYVLVSYDKTQPPQPLDSSDFPETVDEWAKVRNELIEAVPESPEPAPRRPARASRRRRRRRRSSSGEGEESEPLLDQTVEQEGDNLVVSVDSADFRYVNCPKCHKKLSNLGLQIHMKRRHRMVSSNILLKCPYCDKKVKTGSGFQKHVEHTHLRTTSCPICKCDVPELRLEKHLEGHAKNVSFICDQCGQSFWNQMSLSYHVRLAHSSKVVCDMCGKYYHPERIKEHRKLHNPKTIPCPHCPSMFRSDKKLKEHLRCHEQGPADILCQVCGRKFPSQSHLKLHMRVHLEKKFACDQCPKKYPRKAMLDKHLQVHAGDRRFQCAHCPKAYFMVKTLQEHMNSVHLNIRPFTCPHCPKSYASSGARYLHVQLKHKSLAAPANNREHAKEGA